MEERTMSFKKVNVLATLWIIVFSIAVFFPFLLYHGRSGGLERGFDFWVFLYLIGGFVVHELIHGLFFGLFAPTGFKSVSFGIKWKYLTPYCHCCDGLKATHYRIACIMPTIILGITPTIIAYFMGNITLLIFGFVMLVGGIGDMIILWTIRDAGKNKIVYDHPDKIGCMIGK